MRISHTKSNFYEQAIITVTDPILLLGPSGIGKTTVAKYAMKTVRQVHFVVLDNIVHKSARESGLIDKKDNLNALINALGRDRERFFKYGMDSLSLFMSQHQGQPVIVDVGTGFLDANQSLAWVSSKPSLAITADAPEAYDRFRKARKLDISYEQYSSTQFSKHRLACYNSAAIVLKSGQIDEDCLCQRALFALFSLLQVGERKAALAEYLEGH